MPLQRVHANSSLVINEFLVDPDSDQWVELYNKSDAPVDIGGWLIDDNGGSEKFTIPQGTIINPREFMVFASSRFNLNRASSDEVRLLNGSSLVDSYSYSSGPGTNNSYGRTSDGGGEWAIFTSYTKGSTNSASSPQPTPTPQPSPTPIPTKTPTPTRIPTPTKVPTPTKTPSPAKAGMIAAPTNTAAVASFNATSKKAVASAKTASAKSIEISAVPTSVLGASDKSANKKSAKKPTVLVESANQNRFHIYFIWAGSILLFICAILVYFKINKNEPDISH